MTQPTDSRSTDISVGSWAYSPSYGESVRILDVETVWNHTVCQVWVPRQNTVERLPAEALALQEQPRRQIRCQESIEEKFARTIAFRVLTPFPLPFSASLRAGFKECWQEGDYETIIQMAKRVPEAVILEDPALLMYYDNALMRKGE